MPYRRLPTTDKARIRALEAALTIASERGGRELAFSENTLYELNGTKIAFENHLRHHELDLKIEAEKNAEYKDAFEKARLYVSHFIQVLYMNIEREELKEEVLGFYGLENSGKKVPPLNTEQDILDWGHRLIQGEQQRMQHRGSPIYNPSIALVKVRVEDFNEAVVFQGTLKKKVERSYARLHELRRTVNEFISRMWTEIEERVSESEPHEKREKCREYGIVYVLRRNEKKKLEAEGRQVDLQYDFN